MHTLCIFTKLQIGEAVMCSGLGEWWLHKEVLNLRDLVIFNIYAQTVSRIPCTHFVLCKVARLSIFSRPDIIKYGSI